MTRKVAHATVTMIEKPGMPNAQPHCRNQVIDIAKGVGILLVVLGHNWIVGHADGPLGQFIYSFHVLLFFFLSGIFINPDEPFPTLLEKRVQGLVKPYLVVSCLLAVTHFVIATAKHHPESFDLLRYLGGTAYGTGAVVDWTPLWFLPSIFLSVLVAHQISVGLRDRSQWLGYAIALALVVLGTQIIGRFWLGPFQLGFAVTRPAAGLPWSVDLLPLTVGFVLLGRLMADHMKTFTFSTWKFFAAAALFVGLHFMSDNVMDLNNRVYGEPVTSTLKALAGIYVCLSVCALLARLEVAARMFSYIGRATLFVLIFHYPVQMAVFSRVERAVGEPWLAALASLVISVLVSLLLWELTVRYAGLRRLIR